MANQYCKITSWIKHHTPHGDPKYAEAISDLCLDSVFSPSKHPGLTYLYQTNDKIRKRFCSKVFTADSSGLCEEFKRHILPDVFHSCEDFEKKEVGNMLGEKYEVKSCEKNTVIFTNGMKIKSIPSNSFEPLSRKLKDIVKIYYIVEGEPPAKGPKTYDPPHRKREITGGTSKEFTHVYINSKLGDKIQEINKQNIKNAYLAFNIVATMLNEKLHEHRENEELENNIKNLILAQWLVHSIREGIITYIYLCLYILYHSSTSEPFKLIVRSVIDTILDTLKTGNGSEGDRKLYFTNIVGISRDCGFEKSEFSAITNNKARDYIKTLYDRGQRSELLLKFYERLAISPTIWGGRYFPEFYGESKKNIVIYGSYLGLWAITIFTVNAGELDFSSKLGLLDKIFIKIIGENKPGEQLDIHHIFTHYSVQMMLQDPGSMEFDGSMDSDTEDSEIASATANATMTANGRYGGGEFDSDNMESSFNNSGDDMFD